MTSTVSIDTKRLILRTVSMDDVEGVCQSWNLDRPAIYMQEAEKEILRMISNHQQNASGNFIHLCLAIIDKDTKEIIGWCGLDHRKKTNHNPVIFYLLKKKTWNKGIATEAANALIAYAFTETSINQIDGGAAFENLASKRVMEKIGMNYLGLNNEGGYSFSICRSNYRNK